MAGIGFVLLAMILFSTQDMISKILVVDYSPIEIAWGRYLVNSAVIAPFLMRAGRHALATRHPWTQLGRAAGVLGSAITFMAGLRYLPIADNTAIGFIHPLLVTALSIPLLGERVGPRRWMAVLVGFVGALVIIRPGSGTFGWAAIYPLISAVSWAFGLILTRKMNKSESALAMLAFSTLVPALVVSAAVPFVWRPITAPAALLFLAVGLLSAAGQYSLILGYMRKPASVLVPLAYTQLVWATIAGVLAFNTFPDLPTWIGAAIIAASGLYVLHRERVVRARAAEPATT